MDLLSFTYDTYQDVRKNLFRYSVPCLVIAGFFAYFCILPPVHQQKITTLLELMSQSQPWKGLLGSGIGVVLFLGVAFVLTEILQVHDHWYDKYVIKWRHRYATDFILPRLVQPFGAALNYRFHEAAESNTGDFQERLYYPFVSDRDLKIPKNKLVRFYEVVTGYWLTQITEIVLVVLLAVIALYRHFGPGDVDYRTMLLSDTLILFFCFLLNRLWIRSSLKKVRRATDDEIRAIHSDDKLLADLKARLIELCTDYAIPYRERP